MLIKKQDQAKHSLSVPTSHHRLMTNYQPLVWGVYK